MNDIVRVALLALVVVLAVTARADPSTLVGANPLRDLVGPAEYQAMGLAKLSPDEQALLLRWLKLREGGRPVPANQATLSFGVDSMTLEATVATAPPAAPVAAAAATPAAAPAVTPAAPVAPAPAVAIGTTAAFGLESDSVDGAIDGIRAHIVGAFVGWDGKTQFTLDNGQVWRQSSPGTYSFKAQDPEVEIKKALIGYKLRLTETHRSIAVRRVK